MPHPIRGRTQPADHASVPVALGGGASAGGRAEQASDARRRRPPAPAARGTVMPTPAAARMPGRGVPGDRVKGGAPVLDLGAAAPSCGDGVRSRHLRRRLLLRTAAPLDGEAGDADWPLRARMGEASPPPPFLLSIPLAH